VKRMEAGHKWGRRSETLDEDVRGLHDDCDPARFDSFLYAKGYLFGKALLDLETTTECLRDACEF
jgi:hypothetical protein